MATRWYRVPYVPDPRMTGVTAKTLAFNLAAEQFHNQLAAADGYWSETQLSPMDALVKVRGPQALLNAIELKYPLVVDPASVWSPTYEPIAGKICPAKPWNVVDADVFDDIALDKAKAGVDAYITLAIKDGYVRLPIDMNPSLKRYILVKAAQQGYGLNRVSPGTFPTQTTILDNFNRANEDPLSGWDSPAAGFARLTLVSNQAATPAAGDSGAVFGNPANTYGPDCEAYATFSNLASGNYIGVILRGKDYASGSPDFYYCGSRLTANGWFTYRVDNANYVQLGTDQSGAAPAVNDKFGGDIIGTTLSTYSYTSGAWNTRVTNTDSTYAAAGGIGLQTNKSGAFADDFVGGTVVAGGDPEGSLVYGKLVHRGLVTGGVLVG